MNKLHPGARWLFRFGGLVALIPLVIFFAYVFNIVRVIFVLSRTAGVESSTNFGAFLVIIPIAFVLALVVLESYARMAYNRWKFEFTDTNLKKEHGIIWKKYSNVPYERVQNVDIHRGLLARIFGFSSVMIHTAGYSGYGRRGMGAGAEGSIPAVSPEFAEKIRDFLMEKISKRGGGGL